jgi:hypothetical protein
VPFVQAAYAIFTADASPTRSETTGVSSAVPAKSSETVPASGPERYSRVVPGSRGGGPTIPPSTTRPGSVRAVAGETALAST